jgi:molybdopterin-containing oxidoreductase family membrane subunit
VRAFTKFDPGKEQIQTLAKIVLYGTIANLFFFLCEVFVAIYSQIPEHTAHLQYLFFGLHGYSKLVPYMWFSMTLVVAAILLLLFPAARKNEAVLGIACAFVFVGIWIDKGLGMVSGGFIPNPLHEVTEYWPTFPEISITIGIWACGILVLTILYKVVVGVKEEVAA